MLGQDRADRLKRAQAALTKRFTGPPAGNKAPRWQDPQALYWHRRLTTIVDAARRLPADRSEFAHESDSDLRQLADEALRGARAAYTASSRLAPDQLTKPRIKRFLMPLQRGDPNPATDRKSTGNHDTKR